jgi:hypothetical protein
MVEKVRGVGECIIADSASVRIHCVVRRFGFGFWVLGFGFWVLGFGFWVLGFGFWVLGFGFGFGFSLLTWLFAVAFSPVTLPKKWSSKRIRSAYV